MLPINPNIYTDQWEPIVIYIYITLLLFWSLYNYAAHAADIMAPTTAPIYIAGFNGVNNTATVINRQCIFSAVQKKIMTKTLIDANLVPIASVYFVQQYMNDTHIDVNMTSAALVYFCAMC